jgi:hypothetical protein
LKIWIAAGLGVMLLLLIAAIGYFGFTRWGQPTAIHPVARLADEAGGKTGEVQHQTPPLNLSLRDGVYSGQICYGVTRNEPERCYHAEGTVTGGKINGQWTMMDREKRINMLLDGLIGKTGNVTIDIEIRGEEDGTRMGRIDLTGAIHEGLLSASGSFLNGRTATLNWHKNRETPQ